jgi:hypothetical protein
MIRGSKFDRRRLLLAAPALAFAIPGAWAMSAPPRPAAFDVFWRGGKVGHHTITFEEGPDGLRARTDVSARLTIAFIPVFRFEQKGEELWREGLLQRSQVTTDNNGDIIAFEAARDGQSLMVQGKSGEHSYPLGIMTDLALWNPSLADESSIIDVRTGKLVAFELVGRRKESVVIHGRTVEAERVSFDCSDGRRGTMWFDGSGSWLQADLTTMGQEFIYRPRA